MELTGKVITFAADEKPLLASASLDWFYRCGLPWLAYGARVSVLCSEWSRLRSSSVAARASAAL